ncbi:MAG TPA: hypothetical protein VIX84_11485 [Acidimicrobiales bacterium]
MEDLEGWAGERPSPVPEEFGDDRERRVRHSAGVRQPLDPRAVRRW